jgi:ribosome-binding protein aMBF1 (putative translation factor)
MSTTIDPLGRVTTPAAIYNSSKRLSKRFATEADMANIFQFPDRAVGVIPQRIADARMALQMSRTDVARPLEMTGTMIGHYESGDRRPDMGTL